MESVKEILNHWLMTEVNPNQTLIVAYSGGRDSHVLLHALTQLRQMRSFQLRAIHVDHGLQSAAPAWVLHCQTICQQYQVALQVVALNLEIPLGQSLEAVARQARYAQFASLIREQDILLTAHTQADQAETFLLQLLRGSGIKGLSGIAPLKSLGKGNLARPLLEVSREQIADYAKYHHLSWIEDPSNQDLRFNRNRVRHTLIPLLKNINPSIEACIARSAKHCQQAMSLIDAYVCQDTSECREQATGALKVATLKAMPQLKQSYVLRHWLGLHGVMLPSEKKCQDMLKQMLTAKQDANPCVSFGQWQLRRHQGRIYLTADSLPSCAEVIEWDLNQPIKLKDGTIWQARLVQGQGIQKANLITQKLSIAYRQGGERFKGRGGQTKSLKKHLQQQGIAPWLRPTIPLFYHGNELVAVGTMLVGPMTPQNEQGWIIERQAQKF